jgi:hypothetical protein
MKLDLADDDVDLLLRALDHYYAYTISKKAEDSRFRALAERFKRKPSERAGKTPSPQRATMRKA